MSCFVRSGLFRWVGLLSAFSVLGGVGSAAVVSYTISGTVTQVVASDAVAAAYPVGTPWSLKVSWDTAAAPLMLTSTQGQYRMTELTLTLDAASDWTASSVANAASFTVNYESGGTVDALQFTSGWGPQQHTNATLQDMQPYSANLVLTDPTGTAIPSLGSAPTALDFSKWSSDVTKSYLKFYLNNDGNRFIIGKITSIAVTGSTSGTGPAITTAPASAAVSLGGAATFTVAATGSDLTFQWYRNGVAIAAATSATLNLANVQPDAAGLYSVTVTNSGGSVSSDAAILAVIASVKVLGAATQVGSDISHPNGRIYDQVLLTGAAATITADVGQVTRLSYIDLNNDIVQVEFAGAGALTLVLDAATGPAAPISYHQPAVSYMKGHASIVIAGANDTTNVSVFSVGRMTAYDPTGAFNMLQPVSATNQPSNNGSVLFQGHGATNYDGVADLARIVIHSASGSFGGVRFGNAGFFASKGLTGIYAPGVAFAGPVYLHDLNAADDASPVLWFGSTTDTRVTGGSLKQDNSRAIQVSGVDEITFTAGVSSHGTTLAAQSNAAVLKENGADVTNELVVNPGGSTTGTELTFEFTGANPPFPNGSKKLFVVSLTELKFDTTHLTNPTPLQLNAPLTGVSFTDPVTKWVWEVYFKNGAFHEINIMRNGSFAGQWH